MNADAFKPAGGAARPLHAGPQLGSNLGEHFRMQSAPQQAQPMAPRSFKGGGDGGGRFSPASKSIQLGQPLPTAPMGEGGRPIAPERQAQGAAKFRSETQGVKLAGNSGLGTPAQVQKQPTEPILVMVEARGPDNVIYTAPHVVDLPAGSKVLGVTYGPYTEE